MMLKDLHFVSSSTQWDKAEPTTWLAVYRKTAANDSHYPGTYQVYDRDTDRFYGGPSAEMTHFLDAVEAQCVLYELTKRYKGGSDAP